jgi:uncharacterized membrane protein
MKELLQGRPFGHPLHPFLIHFPIGLFVMSLLLDLMVRFGTPSNALVQGAYYTLLGGVVTGIIAALVGLADFVDIPSGTTAKQIATGHMALNVLMLIAFGASLYLRTETLGGTTVPNLPFMLSLAGIALMGISGYLGGMLVYHHAIGVGRHRENEEARP